MADWTLTPFELDRQSRLERAITALSILSLIMQEDAALPTLKEIGPLLDLVLDEFRRASMAA